jgi:hypothetical protein
MPHSRKRSASSTAALWSLRSDPVKYWVDHTSGEARCPWQSYDEKPSSRNTSPLSFMAGHDAGVQCNCCLNMQSRSMLPLGDIISSRALLGSNYG